MSFKHHLLFHAFWLIPFLSIAQMKIGVKSGVNISTIRGFNRDPVNKLGWYAGGTFTIPIERKVSLQSEILFSSKGVGFFASNPSPYVSPKEIMQFNYINLPILLSYGIDNRSYLLLGPELGYLLSVRYKLPTAVYNRDFYHPTKFDIAADIGVGYHLIKRCSIEIRYSYGFKTMRQRDVTGTYLSNKGAHRVFQAGISYSLK